MPACRRGDHHAVQVVAVGVADHVGVILRRELLALAAVVGVVVDVGEAGLAVGEVHAPQALETLVEPEVGLGFQAAILVGAGFAFSDAAGETATAVKLFRVATLLIVLPVFAVAGGSGGRFRLPWFVPGFAGAIALGTQRSKRDEQKEENYTEYAFFHHALFMVIHAGLYDTVYPPLKRRTAQ